jgi:hypothetical protein
MEISFGNNKLRLNILNAASGSSQDEECFDLDTISRFFLNSLHYTLIHCMNIIF